MLAWWEEFSQRPLVAHVLRAIERFNVRGGAQFAAAISYFSVLSLVPVLMLAFSALGLGLTVFFPDSIGYIEDWLAANLQAYGDLGETLLNVIKGALGNWAALGAVGLAIALWTGVNWMGNLKRASRALMRENYDRPPPAMSWPLDLLVNFGGLFLLLGGVALTWAATTAATTLGQQLGEILGLSSGFGWALLVRGVTLVLSLVAGTALFWWMFRWFALSPVPGRLLWIGASVGAAGLITLQVLASYLISAFSRNLTASLFGPVIILMLFMNLLATLILYVAAWLATAKAPVPKVIDEPEPESEPQPVERKPGQLSVSSEVAQKSMGVGLVAGYTVGAATGLGIGAAITAVLGRLRGRRS
jgi:membrane protein